MKTILVIGAGRSSSSMIRYFLNNAEKEDWYIKVGDMDLEMAQGKVGNHARAQAFQFDALNENKRRQELEKVLPNLQNQQLNLLAMQKHHMGLIALLYRQFAI